MNSQKVGRKIAKIFRKYVAVCLFIAYFMFLPSLAMFFDLVKRRLHK